eukprot:SAG31_NODE_2083_length_6490_cov_21.969645_1_plen_92_part_00
MLLAVSGLVNFRPTFKYFSWHTALLGAILNIVVMFYLDVPMAFVTCVIILCLFIYIALFGPDTGWGDISQGLLFQQVGHENLKFSCRCPSG